MSEPVVIRVSRPYATVEDYLQAEARTIDTRGMLLVDAQPLPRGTLVRFVVSIATGEQLIRAEGVARDHVARSATGFGGLRVWFKRFGVATKEVIDRAAAVKSSQADVAPASAPSRSMAGLLDVGSVSRVSSTSVTELPLPPVRGHADPRVAAVAADLTPPPNRDALLARLRERARGMDRERLVRAVAR